MTVNRCEERTPFINFIKSFNGLVTVCLPLTLLIKGIHFSYYDLYILNMHDVLSSPTLILYNTLCSLLTSHPEFFQLHEASHCREPAQEIQPMTRSCEGGLISKASGLEGLLAILPMTRSAEDLMLKASGLDGPPDLPEHPSQNQNLVCL